MENPDNSKKKTCAFSLSPVLEQKIINAAEQEMGGNKSKWLEKELDKIFAERANV